MGNQQSKKAQPPSAAAQAAAITPYPPHYMDYLTRRRHDWPRSADGRPLTCVEVAADIRRSCDYIAHARVFGMRWLQQQRPQPSPLRLTRALYAAPAGAEGAGVCMHVTAAVRLHVRCSQVARVAVGLAAMVSIDQGAGQLRGWAACIAEHVYGCYCRRVEVRQRAA